MLFSKNTKVLPPQNKDKWMSSLQVKKVKTKKDQIKQPFLCMANVFPRINDSVLAVGESGSGKSTVINHLFTNPYIWKNAFDRVFLFSPTGEADDIQKSLGLSSSIEDNKDLPKDLLPSIPSVITDISKAEGYLQTMMSSQDKLIDEYGADKAPLFAVLYDDFIGEFDFMRTKEFLDSFILCRHFNMTTVACAQVYTGVPRKPRMQAKHIFYFKGNQTETDQMIEQYAPPGCDKKTMEEIIAYTTKEKYQFLYINKRAECEDRFRKGFEEVVSFQCDDDNTLYSDNSNTKKRKRKRKN